MEDIAMTIFLALLAGLGSAIAFHSAETGFHAAELVLMLYLVMHYWAKRKATERILAIMLGESPTPELRPAIKWVMDVLDAREDSI